MKTPTIDAIEFRGGRLCLDFINTANWVEEQPVDERLVDLDALRVWVTRKGLARQPELDGELQPLLNLRAAMRRIVLYPDRVRSDDLRIMNDARSHTAPLGYAEAHLNIEAGPSPSPGWITRAIADSAAELVLTTERTRIKTCHGERCGWLFLDESPNNRRRWCSMADCGNRAKAKRHYNARKKQPIDAT